MNWAFSTESVRALEDGLGTRRLDSDPAEMRNVEVLEVLPALAAHDGFEDALRTRVARLAELAVPGVARVYRVDRRGSALRLISEHVEGLRLPDFLHEAVKSNAVLPQSAALDLAGRVLQAAALLHQVPGLSHGTITPSHVVITRNGDVVLTDAVFGPALELLQRNREELWREFRLAFPASASLPRFDQRGDVAQLGATVLAIVLGRPLRAIEYPRSVNEAIVAATLAARPADSGTSASGLRMWLQEALHLHPRATFASAVDAERAFAEAVGASAARRGGATAFEAAVHRIFGDTPESDAAAELAAAWSHRHVVHHLPTTVPHVPPAPDHTMRPPAPEEAPRALGSLLRSVFPRFRAY